MAEEPVEAVRGIVFFGFPLHPAGQPGAKRAEHLSRVAVPMLFLQGTRDTLADLNLLRPVCERLGPRATLRVIETADHSFHVLKRSGQNDAAVLRELARTMAAWAEALVTIENRKKKVEQIRCFCKSKGSAKRIQIGTTLLARHPFDGSPPLFGDAALRILRFRLGRPCWTRWRRIGQCLGLLPYAAKFLINLIYIKLLGVELATNPFREFSVLRVFGVFHGFQKILVAG